MDELAPGTQVGEYRIVSLIGRGGMGTVYLAEHARLERRVALKLLAPHYSNDSTFRARFERESRIAARLDHPNVVPIYEAGQSNGTLFIAMRYVAGPDLRVVLDREGRFTVARALGIIVQLGSALDHAHTQGLIHRDVKPGNVLLAAGFAADGGEHVYLTDFGLTRHSASNSGLTQLGTLVGTIDYIAPEQISGGVIDGRADIYALGCVLFEMLAGRAPFARDSDLATMAAHLHEPPPSLLALRPDLPASADELTRRALAKRPEERFGTAAALVAEARVALAVGSSATVVLPRSDAIPPPSASSGWPTAPGTAAAPAMVRATDSVGTAVHPPAGLQWPTASSIPVSQPGTSWGPPEGWGGPQFPPSGAALVQPRDTARQRLLLALGGGLVLVLLAVVGFAFVAGGPGATPTPIAHSSPAMATVGPPSPFGSPSPSPSPTPTPAPPSPAPPSPSPSPSPVPSPSPPPTPITPLAELLALLQPEVRATCHESDGSFWDPDSIAAVQCPDGRILRDYGLFATSADTRDAYYNLYGTSERDSGDCPDDLPADRGWIFEEGDPERGRISCYINTEDRPQLNFTWPEMRLFGVLRANAPGVTMAEILGAWGPDDGGVLRPKP